MPWKIESDNPECSGWAVVAESDGKVMGCHKTEGDAKAQLAALYANEEKSAEPEDETRAVRPPRDGIRAMPPAELREAEDGRTLEGRLAHTGEWALIDSVQEGRFLERWVAGATRKSFTENRAKIKILFQHGKDAELGNKPIAAINELDEDHEGPYYRGTLLDGVPPLIVDGIRKGLYGTSHAFRSVREDWDPKPKKGAHNPDGIPERTIKEAAIHEISVVTWPAYAQATVGLRSMSDEFGLATLTADPARLRELVDYIEPVAPSEGAGPSAHPEERREKPAKSPPPKAARANRGPVKTGPSDSKEQTTVPDISAYVTRDEKVARVEDINRELESLDKQFDGVLPEEPQLRWDEFVAEKKALLEAVDAIDARRRELDDWRNRRGPGRVEEASQGFTPPPVNIVKARDLASIYDINKTRREARNEEQFRTNLVDNAMRSVDGAPFGLGDRQNQQGEIEKLLKGRDYVDPAEAAKRVLYTGSPAYRRAYRKYLTQGPGGPLFTAEEQEAFNDARTALVTASNVAVPYDLDTTMVINTSGAINPFRQAFRVVKTTSNDWRPLVSSGMTAVYETEATVATDLSPAFTAEARLLAKAHTASLFSVEIQGDYPGLEAELAREIADAKDVLEATEFSTGIGTTHHPMGIFTYYTLNFLDTTTTLVIVPADLYKLEANIGPRYRGNTVWLGSPYFYSLVRGIDTAGGAGLWIDNLSIGNYGSMDNNGRLGNLIGHPAYECIAPANASMATTEKVAILADRDRFVIIDRIGLNIELIPNFLDPTTSYPTGQRMVYAWWRNTSDGIGLNTLGAGREACIFRGK